MGLEPSVTEVDVLVAGAGPSGLMLAIELGRRGIRVLVVDEKASTAVNPQANATQARTMEHYRRLGFSEDVRKLGLPVDHPTDIAYFTRLTEREIARFSLPSSGQSGEVVRKLRGSWSAAELPHRVSQKFVEVILRREAEACDTVTVRFLNRLTQFTDHGDHVEAVVESVELDQRAVNQAEARGPVARRHIGRVEDVLPRLARPQLVITNPPRTGMDERVTAELDRLRPDRLVYISCDPATLARDLLRLQHFELKLVHAFDLFPQTAHVESVAVLEPV